MAPVDPTAISPYLLSFLLGKPPEQEQTTAGLLPGRVNPNVFSNVETDKSGNYRLLSGAANSIQSARADSDMMHSIRMQKKQQQEADRLAQKRNQALLKRIQKLTKDQNKKNPAPPPNPYNPGSPSNYIPPSPPNNTRPSNILPEVKPEGGVGKGPEDKRFSDETRITSPEAVVKDCPTWRKILGLCD